jgi:4-hydroxy-tetrahydrodipicolinate synthase
MLHFAYSETNPVAVKSFLRAVGMPAGPLRKPLRSLSPDALQVGLNIARELGLDEAYGYKLKP